MPDKKNTALFLISTEYVLLISYLYYKNYLEKQGTIPIFVFFKTNPKRLRNISFDNLPGIHLFYKNNLNEGIIYPDKDYFKILKFENINEIVFQNPHNFINSIVIKHYKKLNKNCKLSLIADSAAIDRKMSFKLVLNFLVKLYFRKIFNGIKYLPYKVWTNQNIADKLDLLIARRNINVKNFIDTNSLLGTIPENINKLDMIFNFDIEMFNDFDIIFFTQPVSTQSFSNEYKLKYIEIVKYITELAVRYRKKTIFKVHPGEDRSDYTQYANEFVEIDDKSNVPAEIIINGIKGKKIVSFWSAISLFDINNQNKHFWLYKLINYPLPSLVNYNFISEIEKTENIEKQIFIN